MPKISVVIPAYNCERFLPETLDSLISQTLNDLEIIIINDGSVDGTQAVIDRYKKEHGFIKSFYQENSGVSSARNNGLLKASGEYVVFLDGDDTFTETSLEAFYNKAKQTGADIVMGRLRNVTDGVPGPFHAYADALSKEDSIDTLDTRLVWSVLVSNKCYNRKRLLESKVKFPPYTFSEEAVFFLNFVFYGATMAGTADSCLCYRRHTKSEGESVSQSACEKNLSSLNSCMTILENAMRLSVENEATERKAAFLEQLYFKHTHVLLSQFYRRLWSMDESSVKLCCETYLSLLPMLSNECFFELQKQNEDLDLQNFRGGKKEIAETPIFSFYAPDEKTLSSLFNQACPLFEVFVTEETAKALDENYLKCENLKVVKSKHEAKKLSHCHLLCLDENFKMHENLLKHSVRLSLPKRKTVLAAFNKVLFKREGASE